MEITGLPVAATIDGSLDTFPIVTNSLNATQQINRNTFLGLASTPVGLTDTQTLTNKTLTSPTISAPVLSGTITGTYTLGGTPTFPAAVVTLTGTQALTNKTLTSPTINTPTISNATITSDSYAGYTGATTGSIYGISVTAGAISSALSLTSTLAVTGATTLSSTLAVTGAVSTVGQPTFQTGTAPPAAGLATAGILMSSTASLGLFYGTGAPTFSAAKGSLYINTSATTTTTRLYINSSGSTTWTTFTTAA
jgi:hypothetical protein